MERPVLVLCECCGSEGRILTSNGGPYDTDNGECPVCKGDGLALVESEAVTQEDLDQMDASKCDCGTKAGHAYGCAIFKCSVGGASGSETTIRSAGSRYRKASSS